jgi:glutathione-regulated potassium-efflux system ancillary protein KefG
MKTSKILILFAHPLFEKSMVNKALVSKIPQLEGITFHDLYEAYPEFDVDVKKEQALLESHDIIIWHHPLYWYSCPPLLKQWIDMVLEYNWAYGTQGSALKGKKLFQVITTGGAQKNYCDTGKDRYTIPELLEPFNQTAKVCKMDYLPPFVIHGTHQMDEKEANQFGQTYSDLLKHLQSNDIDLNEVNAHFYLNDWFHFKLKNHG